MSRRDPTDRSHAPANRSDRDVTGSAPGADGASVAAAADPVGALVAAVREALGRIEPPRGRLDARGVDAYVVDLAAIAFDGDERARIGLLARLLRLAAVSAVPDRAAADPLPWLSQLERLLREWDELRRRAAARPRPRRTQLESLAATLRRASDGERSALLPVFALEAAELTAVHVLAGEQPVEAALAALDELGPLLDLARHELAVATEEEPAIAGGEAGAVLARAEHAAWQAGLLLEVEPVGDVRRRLVRRLTEVAAALLLAHDLHAARADHEPSWRRVRDRAAEAIHVGRLGEQPAAVDVAAALERARAEAFALAVGWLDELRSGEQGAVEAPGAVLDACARCLVAAWAQARLLPSAT